MYLAVVKDRKAFALSGISCENTVRTPREISSSGILFVTTVVFNVWFFLCESRHNKLNPVKEYWMFCLNYFKFSGGVQGKTVKKRRKTVLNSTTLIKLI